MNCPIFRRAIGAAIAAGAVAASTASHAAPAFPSKLSANNTGAAAVIFLGAPDDRYLGLGGDSLTYDFGPMAVMNRPGQVDLNVYEVDFGGPEFEFMNILISQDGVNFVGIKPSQSALVRIVGDSAHSNASFARSYDLGALGWARYVRIQGTGNGHAGGSNYFDLDAIGAHEVAPIPVPEPGTWALMLAGLAGVAGVARRRSGTRD